MLQYVSNRLSDHLQRRCDVVNRGFSGYTSRHILSHLDAIATPDLLDGAVCATVFIGANDANDEEVNPHQHVPVNEYKVGAS